MIKIKVEIEESEETPLLRPIENENVDSPSGNKVTKKLPEKNVVEVPKKKNKKKLKPKQLDNFTTDSVAVGSKSIKTEPVESSLSLTTQLNLSQNIQRLLIRNQIQNEWTTNEQSIPIGTQQQQQQSLLSFEFEPIIPENHLEITLSLIPNSNSEKNITATRDSGSGSINGGGIQNPASSSVVPFTIIGSKKSSPTPLLSLEEERKARRLEKERLRYHRKKANPKPVDPEVRAEKRRRNSEYRRKWRQKWMANATPEQLELMRSKERERVKQYLRKESEEEQREQRLLEQERQYNNNVEETAKSDSNRTTILKTKSEIMAEKRRQKVKYCKKYRQQKMANATPEQLERIRVKDRERARRQLEKETEEQREHRLERSRQYKRTLGKQRKEKTLMSSSTKKTTTKTNDNNAIKMEISGDESIGNQTTTSTLVESPKPGPSKKLPRPTRSQSNLKLKQCLESSDTDSD